jgi:cytochrome oxidase Cu insertion factor (SCO1/SenC/PrrC family)
MSAPLMAGSTDPRNDRRQRRLLVGLAALFFAPIALSFYLYYGHSTLKPVSHVNRGTLIVPPHTVPEGGLPLLRSGVPTDAAFLRSKWTLLYVNLGPCAEQCRRKLYDTRQVRTALDRDMTRVQRVFVTSADCCDADWLEHEHPDLIAVLAAPADGRELTTPGSGAPLLTSLPTFDSIPAGRADRVYVIDPLGNLMMTYPSDFQPKGLLEDMHRLLKLSHIG